MSDEMKKDSEQEQFDAWVKNIAPSLNAPGDSVPRDEMWRAIQAKKATRVLPFKRPPWRVMSLIAAALLLGVAVDRMVLRKSQNTPQVAVVPAPTPARPDSAEPTRLYRMAATQTLTQAEAFLTAYRASGTSQRDPAMTRQLGRWGRDVLGSTRLLIDSPAGDDPQLRALFNDLELVLVQIIQISGGQLDAADRKLIDRALESKDLIPRIRTVVPAGNAASASATTLEN